MNVDAAKEFVQEFLRLMEARDLDAAEQMMAPNARIVFPGGRIFASQREMVEAAKGRYQWVKKNFDSLDAFQPGDNAIVVYVRGTLYGVNRHGVEFSGVRYIDRFTLADGLIFTQEVWNDLAESGVLERTS